MCLELVFHSSVQRVTICSIGVTPVISKRVAALFLQAFNDKNFFGPEWGVGIRPRKPTSTKSTRKRQQRDRPHHAARHHLPVKLVRSLCSCSTPRFLQILVANPTSASPLSSRSPRCVFFFRSSSDMTITVRKPCLWRRVTVSFLTHLRCDLILFLLVVLPPQAL
jgi:hypothetical protein